MFHSSGKHIGVVGQFGTGPGEYTSPSSFGIDGNLLYIFDSDSQRINYYHLSNMNFSHSLIFNTPSSSRYITIHKKQIYADAYTQKEQNTYLIQEIDSLSGQTKNKWLSTDEYNSGYLDFVFWGESLFYKSDNSIKYHQRFMNRVMQIKDDEVSPYLILKSNKFITKEKLSELRNQKGWSSEHSLVSIDAISNIHQYVEWGDYIQFSMDRKIYRNTIFFNKKTNETHLTELVYDDLTFIENQQDINVYPIPIWGDEEGQLSYIHPIEMENFVKFIKEGKTNLSTEPMRVLQGLSSDSNPVLIYYEKK